MKFIKRAMLIFTFAVGVSLGVAGATAQAADPGVQYTVYKVSAGQYRMIVVSPPSGVCSTASVRAGIADKGHYIAWPSFDKAYVPCDGGTRIVNIYAFTTEPPYDRFGVFLPDAAYPYGRVASLYVP